VNIACILGNHKWDGCNCARCGKAFDRSCDPLQFAADFGSGEANEKRLNAFFLRLEAVSLTVQAIDCFTAVINSQGVSASMASEARESIRSAEVSLAKDHVDHAAALQAGLLVTYFSGDEGRQPARKYLIKWFKGCDVERDHAVLEAFVTAAKPCNLDENAHVIVGKCAENLPRWRSKGFKI
jgi:hypothetical protein